MDNPSNPESGALPSTQASHIPLMNESRIRSTPITVQEMPVPFPFELINNPWTTADEVTTAANDTSDQATQSSPPTEDQAELSINAKIGHELKATLEAWEELNRTTGQEGAEDRISASTKSMGQLSNQLLADLAKWRSTLAEISESFGEKEQGIMPQRDERHE